MKQIIGAMSLLVRDYDEAISFYTEKLGFVLMENADRGGGKRGITVSPPGSSETRVLLAKAASPEQESLIGKQTGGRVFLFLHTDDFWQKYEEMKGKGIHFLEEPRTESYGMVVVFEDLYGNKWDLLEAKK